MQVGSQLWLLHSQPREGALQGPEGNGGPSVCLCLYPSSLQKPLESTAPRHSWLIQTGSKFGCERGQRETG